MIKRIHKLKEVRSEEGFTLIELMIVVVIIGILAAIAIPVFANQQKAAMISATQTDMRNLVTVISTETTKTNGNIPYGCAAGKKMLEKASITPGTELRYSYSTTKSNSYYLRTTHIDASFNSNAATTEADNEYRGFFLSEHGAFYKDKAQLGAALIRKGTNLTNWLSSNSWGTVIATSTDTGTTYSCSGGVS